MRFMILTLALALYVWSISDAQAADQGVAGPAGAPARSAVAATRPVVERIPRATVDVELVQVPGGKLHVRDSAGKQRAIDVKPFLIQRTEARWDEIDVMWLGLDLPEAERTRERLRPRQDAISGPSRCALLSTWDRGWGHAGSPVGSLQIKSVKNYIEWLNQVTGKAYRLPTEAEWEWACRAGAAEPLKPAAKELERVAWTDVNSDDQSHPVGTKAANAWGLYDMLGNMAEWVVREDGTFVTAGGSFMDDPSDIHSAAREGYSPRWQRNDPGEPQSAFVFTDGGHIGFRLVREVEGEKK